MELRAVNSPVEPIIIETSPESKIERIWDFVRECIFKEFSSCLRHTWYRIVSWLHFHPSSLNPVVIAAAGSEDEVAKVILLLHGAGAHPSCFIPLAKKLEGEGITHLHTVDLNQTGEDPVPTDSVAAKIEQLRDLYLEAGYQTVDFALVGHSLGALCSHKLIWRQGCDSVSLMISLAGRLRYLSCRFSWFCEDVSEEINASYRAFLDDRDRVPLYSIWGQSDAIVPRRSAFIQENADREVVVEGWGHGGIVYAPEAHQRIIAWIQDWMNHL